jgi:hypothetical protein
LLKLYSIQASWHPTLYKRKGWEAETPGSWKALDLTLKALQHPSILAFKPYVFEQ